MATSFSKNSDDAPAAPHQLSNLTQRWRAAPHALPALIRDHHAGGPADRGEPQLPPNDPDHNDSPGTAFLAVMAALVIYVVGGIVYAILAGGNA
ncbi:hypothetical protein [Sphingomonas sp. 2378]|uniref:hypothetical protein n=1 Tax=Sphingomonas sp. 2378 TaxID=1219748 RepID=UPI00311ADB65